MGRHADLEGRSRHITSRVLVVALLGATAAGLACSPSRTSARDAGATVSACGAPRLPEPSDAFVLGTAGAPASLFGPPDAPTFVEAFDHLKSAGFNTFVPIFLTSETGEGTGHDGWFFPAALSGSRSRSCDGSKNPWRAAKGRIGLVFTPQALGLPTNEPIDAARLTGDVETFARDCLGGDRSLVRGTYNLDEPGSGYVGSTIDTPEKPFVLSNVATVAAVSRAVLGAPVLVVEAALPFGLPYLGARPEEVEPLTERFWRAVDQTSVTADLYGFDVYPVGLTDDLGVVGDYVLEAARVAPGRKHIAVLQGFGHADMKIELGTGRRPTPEEVRVMAWDAVVNGAHGIFFYGPSAIRRSDEALWESLRATVSELSRFSGVIEAPGTLLPRQGPTRLAFRANDIGEWMFVVNPSSRAAEVTLSWPGKEKRIVDAATGEAVSTDGTLSFSEGAYGVRIFAAGACAKE